MNLAEAAGTPQRETPDEMQCTPPGTDSGQEPIDLTGSHP